MKITITVTDPTTDFQRDLLGLLERHSGNLAQEVPDNRWTVERAGLYYERLPPRAREILRDLAVAYDGAAEPDELRVNGKSLRGCTGAFRRILNEGARRGLWPADLPVPVQSVTKGGKLVQLNMPGWTTPEDDTFQPFYDFFEEDAKRRDRAKGSTA